ncbi:cuticle protein 18.7 [Fopius arisanus]|uniref:Cuticle protein 18.7 n=1 Tax=Fopius arisanus TaxID=64838 RepID=A0A0C9RS23_9HYME|nr:PREDICTED: cuticle protein 18.7-like [Fopius arisanus]
MKTIAVILCIFGVARASAPLAYGLPLVYAKLEAGAPIGLDGRVVDTPAVAYAKAEHAAAHINERLNHAAAASEAVVIQPAIARLGVTAGAPLGVDGRVVDTPEVSLAKAEHAAAHLNEQLRSTSPIATYTSPIIAPAIVSPLPVITKAQSGAPIGLDGRVVDTPEVALAKAEHAAAHINAKLENNDNYLYLSSPSVQYYY